MGSTVILGLGGGGIMTSPSMGGVARGASPTEGVLSWSLSVHPSGITQASNVAVGSGTAETVLSFGSPAQSLGITQASIGPFVVAGPGASVTVVSTAAKGTAAAVAASRANAAVLIFIFTSLDRFADSVVSNKDAGKGFRLQSLGLDESGVGTEQRGTG